MMRLKLAREADLEIQSEADLRQSLLRLGDANEFAILSLSKDDFIQAGVDGNGFVVNRSASAARTVLWASPEHARSGSANTYHRFTIQGVQELFAAYYRREPLSHWDWQIEQLLEPTAASKMSVLLLRYALWPTVIALFIASFYWKYIR